MNYCRKYAKWACNLFLLVIALSILALLVLNVVSPGLPSIKCKGNVTHDPDISHTYKGDTISTVMILSIALLVPFLELLAAEWVLNKQPESAYAYAPPGTQRWKRTFLMACRWYRDYFFGIGFMLLMNDIAKTTVGAPRPHWIDTCQPAFRAEDCHLGWVDSYKCTGTGFSNWKMADSRKSFPSGHSALGFYAAIFMIFYQTNRLKLRRVGSVVILFLNGVWSALAIFCALSRVSDRRHHFRDVIGGGILGGAVSIFTSVVLCKRFRNAFNLEPYQSKIASGLNGNATILDGFNGSPDHQTVEKLSPGSNANNGSVPPRLNGDLKKPSFRRLLSTQSNITSMTDIAEHTELDNL